MRNLCLIFILFSSFCTKNETISKPETLPVLEISQTAQGMWGVKGKTLFFRLYENGFAEYEDVDDSKRKKNESSANAEEINTLRQAVLNKDKTQKFIELIRSAEFQKLSQDYGRKCCCTDADLAYQITVLTNNQSKTFNLSGYCELDEIINPQNRYYDSEFPRNLSELMKLAYFSRLSLSSSNQSE